MCIRDRTLVSAEAMRAGEALYAANNCTACHGELASAKTAQVPLQNLAARYDQAAMVALFKVPPSSMPPVTLPADDLKLLADYLLATR